MSFVNFSEISESLTGGSNSNSIHINIEDIDVSYYSSKLSRKQKKRKVKLLSELQAKNLEYVRYGICDAYVLYGNPKNVSTVISVLLKNTKEENRRKTRLMRRLAKMGINCDDIYKIEYFRDYIENDTDINVAIEQGIKELFLVYKTNYLNYLYTYYDEEQAEYLALEEYYKENKNDDEKINIMMDMFDYEIKYN